MGTSILRLLGQAAETALSRRAYLSWAALTLSLGCQAAAAAARAASSAASPAFMGMPVAFAAALGFSVVLTIGMFVVRTSRLFRILLFPRVIVLGILLSLAPGQRGLDMLLTLPLLMEISIAEQFPGNLALCAGTIVLSAASGMLLLSGGTTRGTSPGAGFPPADWLVVSALFALAAGFMLRYREQMIQLEQERRRLDAAVGELAHANLGYQKYTTVLEQRTMLEERKRITREIHDIIGYTLTNNIMMMEAAVEMVRRDPQRVSALITDARRSAEEGLDGIRNALYLLRAQEDPQLAGMDLIAKLTSSFRAATGVTVRLEYGNARGRIDHDVEGVLFHVIQEALTNSFRHGHSTLVEVLFWIRDNGTLVMNVRDNGGGAVDIHEGIGVSGMRERLEPIGGTLRLLMSPQGFTVTVEVPPRGPRATEAPAPAATAVPAQVPSPAQPPSPEGHR